jgi:hypothetical protein
MNYPVTIHSVSQKSWWGFKSLDCWNETQQTHKQVELGRVVGSCASNMSKVTLTLSDLHKKATVQKKAQRFLWLAKFEFVTQE